MKIFFAHSSSYDYVKELYEPLKTSRYLTTEHECIFPMDNNSLGKSKEEVQKCDLLIAEVSLPSTGQGMEIGWADAAGIPIFTIAKKGSNPSGALFYVVKETKFYNSKESLITVTEAIIKDLRS